MGDSDWRGRGHAYHERRLRTMVPGVPTRYSVPSGLASTWGVVHIFTTPLKLAIAPRSLASTRKDRARGPFEIPQDCGDRVLQPLLRERNTV